MDYGKLRTFGWTHKPAPRKYELHASWVYLRPGATAGAGAVGRDIFFNEDRASAFARDWCVGVDGRSGHVDEAPPTSEHLATRDAEEGGGYLDFPLLDLA